MNLKQIAQSVALASALVASTGALAANDGTLGATSTGDLTVSLSVADRVQISGLDDIALGAYGGTGNLVGGSAFCVYRNGTGMYNLTVSSANADGGAFRAFDGDSAYIGYSVRAGAGSIVGTGAQVDSDDVQSGLLGNGTSVNCGGANNATLQVTFLEADLQAAPTGSFNDVITLLVEPS